LIEIFLIVREPESHVVAVALLKYKRFFLLSTNCKVLFSAPYFSLNT
jgi:hypothetical protein